MSKCGRALVRSRSLKVLSTCGSFDELFVEDAPNLEVLLGDAMYMRPVHLKVAHAPKLEFLGYLGMSFRAIQIVDSILEVSSLFCQISVGHGNCSVHGFLRYTGELFMYAER